MSRELPRVSLERVAVADVQIGFWRLVWLMTKLYLAAIPALILVSLILGLIAAGVMLAVGGSHGALQDLLNQLQQQNVQRP